MLPIGAIVAGIDSVRSWDRSSVLEHARLLRSLQLSSWSARGFAAHPTGPGAGKPLWFRHLHTNAQTALGGMPPIQTR